MASYSAIPLQSLNSGIDQEDTSYFHVDDTNYLKPKGGENVFVQPSSIISSDARDSKPYGKQTTTRRASYGQLALAWWQEIVSFIIAGAAFMAIAIILAKYNGQEQPNWKYSLNLSTLVAILSTLLRVSMVVIVEEIVSQMKWLWFKVPRRLRHLSYFDQAARGPWGSLLLPFRIRRINMALLGGLIVVLSLAIGPFTQQAIKNVSCEKPVTIAPGNSPVAQLPIAHMVPVRASTRFGAGLFTIDVDVKGAIINGLSNPTGNLSDVSAVCPSGNCTFPSYASSAFCNKCTDVTSFIKEVTFTSDASGPEGSSNLTLPNNLTIGNGPASEPVYWLNISADVSLEWANIKDSVMLAALPASIFNFTLLQITDANCTITANITTAEDGIQEEVYTYDCPHHGLDLSSGWKSYSVVASSCAIYPCVKNYQADVTNGVLNEEVVSEAPLLFDTSSTYSFLNQTAFNTPCVVDDQYYTLANVSKVPARNHNLSTAFLDGKNVTVPDQCYFQMDGTYIRALYLFLSETLVGACDFPSTNGEPENIDPRFRSKVLCFNTLSATSLADSWWLQTLYNSGNATSASIQHSIDAISTAITNKVRTFGTDWDGLSQAFVSGESSRTTICTQVDWYWLIFPAILLALTLFLLIIIALRTLFSHGNMPIWKSSILPLLFSNNTGIFRAASGHRGDIDDAADQNVVSLQQEGNGWAFVKEGGGGSSAYDANNPIRQSHRASHGDWPGPSSGAFIM